MATEIFPGTSSSPNDDAPRAKTTPWGRRTLVKPVLYTFLGLGTAVPSILCVIFYLQMSEMDIRLNSLEATLRSGQLNQLSVSVTELEKHVAEQDLRFATNEKLDAGMQDLSSGLIGMSHRYRKKMRTFVSNWRWTITDSWN